MYFSYSILRNWISFWPNADDKQLKDINTVGNIYNKKYFQLIYDKNRDVLEFKEVNVHNMAYELVSKAIKRLLADTDRSD
jgi:hypothetical protein